MPRSPYSYTESSKTGRKLSARADANTGGAAAGPPCALYRPLEKFQKDAAVDGPEGRDAALTRVGVVAARHAIAAGPSS